MKDTSTSFHNFNPNEPIIHICEDGREINMSPKLIGLVIIEVAERLMKIKNGLMQEPLEQIVLNKYTLLKLVEESKKKK